MAPHRRLLAAGLGLLLAAGLVCGLELAARSSETTRIPDHSVPQQSGTDALTLPPHPYLLWEQTPGDRKEHGVDVHINRLGLRGPEVSIPKPAGIRRIVSIGDSSVYGFGVPIDASFTQVTTELLGGRAAGLEGIAAALPGYSTLQLLNLLELRAADLEPDLLVVAALWSDNATAAVGDAALLDRYQRWDLGTAGAADRLLRRSALVRVLTWELSVRRGAQARARADYSTAVPHPDGHQHRVPVADYRQNLDSLAAIARDRDAAIAFVVLPHPEDLEERTRGVSSFHAYRDAMRGAAQDHDAPLVEGGELFARAAADDSGLDRDALFLDNIHPSILGHRLLGDALAPALEAWERQTRP